MVVDVRLLGRFEVTVDGRIVPPTAWSRRRQAASLVKLLALTPGCRLHREQVIDALWPGLSVETAAPRLRQAAHHVRTATGLSGSVVSSGGLIMLFPDAEVRVDTVAFEAAAVVAAASGRTEEVRN